MEKHPISYDPRGAIDLIYGPFGSGKNTYAAKIAKSGLHAGIPVFSSFPVRFEGYDESKSFFKRLLGVLGLKTRYLYVPKENFHRLTMDEISKESFVQKLFHMQKCIVIIDEGYASRLLDSYRKTNVSVDARLAVYTTRHFDRRFIIVAQRPNSIHVSSRAMVNRFFKCSQPLGDNTILSNAVWSFFGFRWFIFTEYQEMLDETVDENKPLRQRWIFAGKKLLSYFDSKYMAEGYSNDYPTKAYSIQYTYIELLRNLFKRPSRFSATELSPIQDVKPLPTKSIRVISKT